MEPISRDGKSLPTKDDFTLDIRFMEPLPGDIQAVFTKCLEMGLSEILLQLLPDGYSYRLIYRRPNYASQPSFQEIWSWSLALGQAVRMYTGERYYIWLEAVDRRS